MSKRNKKHQKSVYGKCFVPDYHVYNVLIKDGKTSKEALEIYAGLLCEMIKENDVDPAEMVTRISCFHAEIRGDNYHLYVENECLKDVFISSEVRDVTGLFDYVSQYGHKEFNPFIIRGTIEDNCISFDPLFDTLYFCLYFPNENKCTYVSLILLDAEKLLLSFIIDDNDEKSNFKGSVLLNKGEKPVFKCSKESKIYFRMIINTIIYCMAFPDCVRNGLPKNVRLSESFKSKKLVIKTSEKLIKKTVHNEHGAVVPHLRRGFFRYCGSDWYKDKKGQYVFVESTFVKGHGIKTIE